MTSLLSEVLEAHGGLERWRQCTMLSATIVTGGEFWSFRSEGSKCRPPSGISMSRFGAPWDWGITGGEPLIIFGLPAGRTNSRSRS